MCDTTLNNTAANLRSVASKNFMLPQAKCNLFKGSLSYSGVMVWNIIPVSIKDSSSLPIFIKKCTEWIEHGIYTLRLYINWIPPPPFAYIK